MSNNKKPPMPVLIEDLGMMYPREKSKRKMRYGLYRCICGIQFKTASSSIMQGHTNSCGCYKKSISQNTHTTHGYRNHRIYKTWSNMIDRCCNSSNKRFCNYGGIGISVCDRWKDVSLFIEDMYPSFAEGLSLDRIDVSGNYEPSNCRWENKATQARNTHQIRSTNTSGYRGVFLDSSSNKWRARICVDYKKVSLGSFDTSLDAAIAYNNYVITNKLEHGLNKI